ncbi:MAG: hypothetical protein KW804_00030 [Candidatus Doudnabacteria bacterium]|nr:hypothetical protein [Candidatus Doudnabacteria bacterium]
MRKVFAWFLFTPPGTPKDRMPKAPDDFLREVSRVMEPQNLKKEVITCWTVINGVSSGTRGTLGAVDVDVELDALVAGWYQKGVESEGKPGFEIWRPRNADGTAKTVKLTAEHNKGNVISPYDIIWCGNLGFDIRPEETAPMSTGVTAAAPPPPPSDKPLTTASQNPVIATEAPPNPAIGEQSPEHKGGWIPCLRGKYNKLACVGIAAGIAYWKWPRNTEVSTTTATPPLIKTGSPGGRD